jgi:hypothetical protein
LNARKEATCKIDRMLYAGNNLERARENQQAVKHRPGIRLTIRHSSGQIDGGSNLQCPVMPQKLTSGLPAFMSTTP